MLPMYPNRARGYLCTLGGTVVIPLPQKVPEIGQPCL